MNTIGELNDITVDAGAWAFGFSIGRALFLIHTLESGCYKNLLWLVLQ